MSDQKRFVVAACFKCCGGRTQTQLCDGEQEAKQYIKYLESNMDVTMIIK